MKINETKIKVRYVETDQMGIVHHSNYFAWFEVGRTELIKQQGLSYKEIEARGVIIPLIECGAQFKTGAKYEDELIIRTSMSLLTPVKMDLNYEVIRDSDGKLLATGFTRHAFTNRQLKPMNVKKNNPEVWALLESAI
jgi:acyl-CoA thioester hydrolase